jgi:hypothetical protein
MLDDGQVKEWHSLLARAIHISLGKDGGPDDDGQTVGRLLEALDELALERAPLTVNLTNQVLKAQAVCDAETSRLELEVLQQLRKREADAAQAEATSKQHEQWQQRETLRRHAFEMQQVREEVERQKRETERLLQLQNEKAASEQVQERANSQRLADVKRELAQLEATMEDARQQAAQRRPTAHRPSPVAQASGRQCTLCLVDDEPALYGLLCSKSSHFIDEDCVSAFLEMHGRSAVMRMTAAAWERAECSGCKLDGVEGWFILDDLLLLANDANVQERNKVNMLTTHKQVKDAAVEQRDKQVIKLAELRDEERRLTPPSALEVQVEAAIVDYNEAVLLDHCPDPNCKCAWTDFDGCWVLSCKGCEKDFCAWCDKLFGKNCRTESHDHVRACAGKNLHIHGAIDSFTQMHDGVWKVHEGVRRGKRYTTWLQTLTPDVRSEFLRLHAKNLVEDGLVTLVGDDE